MSYSGLPRLTIRMLEGKKMHVTPRLLFVVCLAAIGLLAMNASAQDGTARISPSNLFTGELARIEPHLGLSGSGCVKVTFDGMKELSVELQVWKDGKSTSVVSASQSPVKAGEVSISVREAANSGGKMMYKVIVAGPAGTLSNWVDIPEGMRSNGSANLNKETAIKDGVPVAVWAMVATKSGVLKFDSNESVEQMAKRADWALVLNITLAKNK